MTIGRGRTNIPAYLCFVKEQRVVKREKIQRYWTRSGAGDVTPTRHLGQVSNNIYILLSETLRQLRAIYLPPRVKIHGSMRTRLGPRLGAFPDRDKQKGAFGIWGVDLFILWVFLRVSLVGQMSRICF